MNQPRTEAGKFGSQYKEPRGKAIAFRLPQSIDVVVRTQAEQQGIDLKDWLVDAVQKKLAS